MRGRRCHFHGVEGWRVTTTTTTTATTSLCCTVLCPPLRARLRRHHHRHRRHCCHRPSQRVDCWAAAAATREGWASCEHRRRACVAPAATRRTPAHRSHTAPGLACLPAGVPPRWMGGAWAPLAVWGRWGCQRVKFSSKRAPATRHAATITITVTVTHTAQRSRQAAISCLPSTSKSQWICYAVLGSRCRLIRPAKVTAA